MKESDFLSADKGEVNNHSRKSVCLQGLSEITVDCYLGSPSSRKIRFEQLQRHKNSNIPVSRISRIEIARCISSKADRVWQDACRIVLVQEIIDSGF